MKNKVAFLLFLSIATMSLLPLFTGYYLLDMALTSQGQIYGSSQLEDFFSDSQINLKRLAKFEPDREAIYKEQFSSIQDLKLIYGDDEFFRDKVKYSVAKFFLIGFIVAIVLSTILGFILSLVINRLFVSTQRKLEEEREQTRYLEDLAKWQEVAKKLAHEIRRPLQPITLWISNLKECYGKNENSDEYKVVLKEATQAISDEIKDLDAMVKEFSKFAILPKVQIEESDIILTLNKIVTSHGYSWKMVTLNIEQNQKAILCDIDERLFRQAIVNIVENAIEANPGEELAVEISISTSNGELVVDIENSGKDILAKDRESVFDLYFSTKSDTRNMGLGLAIVKKSILEQNGRIECLAKVGGAHFRITLPIVEEAKVV